MSTAHEELDFISGVALRPIVRGATIQRRRAVKESKLQVGFSLITRFVFCVFAFLGQSTGPLLADATLCAAVCFLFVGGDENFTHRLNGGN